MSNDTLITIVAAILAVGLVLYIARKIGRMAERRGRDFYTWSVFAFVLPVPAAILLYCLPNKAPPDIGLAAKQF